MAVKWGDSDRGGVFWAQGKLCIFQPQRFSHAAPHLHCELHRFTHCPGQVTSRPTSEVAPPRQLFFFNLAHQPNLPTLPSIIAISLPHTQICPIQTDITSRRDAGHSTRLSWARDADKPATFEGRWEGRGMVGTWPTSQGISVHVWGHHVPLGYPWHPTGKDGYKPCMYHIVYLKLLWYFAGAPTQGYIVGTLEHE